MKSERDDAGRGRRGEHADPELGRRVHHELPGLPGPGRRETRHQALEFGGRNGEQHQLGAFDHLRHGEHRYPRQQGVGALAAGVRHRRDADDRVTGSAECGPEHRPDPSGTDDPDPQPPRPRHRSTPSVVE
jgi:hypothetical protein